MQLNIQPVNQSGMQRTHGRPDHVFVGRQVFRFLAPLARWLSQHRRRRGKLRSVWGGTPILTLPLLARCDRILGIDSRSLVFKTYRTTRAFDVSLEKYHSFISRRAPKLRLVFEAIVFAYAILRYDVFHYFADRGILSSQDDFGIRVFEQEVLQAAGKTLYVYTYGADVRLRNKTLQLGTWNFCRDCDDPGAYCLCDDEKGEALLKRIADFATATVSLGDMLTYLPGARHVAYWPIDHERIAYVGAREHAGPLKIAHAPNHTHFKGTRYLEQSLARLDARGVHFELVVISGVSNAEVLDLLAEADIVADQFIGGAYGYTALEGMARGKPVLTYVRDRSLTVAPDECPFINATPDTLDDVLTWCAHNRALLPHIGRQGRSYVERHHSIPAVAARLARLYIDTADFPRPLIERFEGYIADEEARMSTIATYADWSHPWSAAEGSRAC
ncbi:MAG: hypothetical protein AB7S70_03415 [Hyphomicrobium sp.]